jgi:hypothetical protein
MRTTCGAVIQFACFTHLSQMEAHMHVRTVAMHSVMIVTPRLRITPHCKLSDDILGGRFKLSRVPLSNPDSTSASAATREWCEGGEQC